eukprot:g10858.t1
MSRSSSSNPLRGLGEQLLTLVWESASKEQLGQWLRVPLEHAAAKHSKSSDALCFKLLLAGADAVVRRHSVLDRSPLLAAAQAGNDAVVSALLENGSAPDGEDWETSVLLSDVILAAGGVANIANTCTSLVTDADSSSISGLGLAGDGLTTPLHLAASGGHLSMVKTLVRAGADADVEDENGDTPVHLAVFRGFEQVVEELVAAGASVDTIDAEGETPLHTASAHGSLGIVRAILRGSPGDTKTLLLCHKDHLEMSPFHRAALGGHCDVMEELLSHGSSLHSLAGNARTPLHAAAMSSSGDAVRFLLRRDPGALEAADRDGRTALHLASGHRLGSDGTLLALLEAGGNIEARTCLGETPLHGACRALRVSAVQQLLRFGADEGAVDRDGCTPSALASSLLQSQCPGMFRDMLKIILQLLAAAPADKVWRRRGWLVMLRSRQRGEVGPCAEATEQWLSNEGVACAIVLAGAGEIAAQNWEDQEDGYSGSRGRPRKIGKAEGAAQTAAASVVAGAAVVARERYNLHPCYLAGNGRGGASRLVGVGGGETFRDGSKEGDQQLRSVVERVIGICEEGVFRNIVAFL